MRKGQHHTLESRKKMSNNWTKEKKKELSEKRTGTGNPMYGKHLSPETKALLSSIRKEIPRTEEWCENISKALTGNPNASHPHTEESKRKLSEANKGKKISQKHREAISRAQKGKPKLTMRGSGNPAWKGGTSFEPYCPKFNKAKREEIREKFGRKCINCGKPESENMTKDGKFQRLAVHHIYYDKKEGCNESELHLVPLCITCHLKTNTKREYWIECLIKKIEEYLKENGDDK